MKQASIAEVQPIFCKDSAKQTAGKTNTRLFAARADALQPFPAWKQQIVII